MANDIINRVVAKDNLILREKLLNKDGNVDFNILIPIHEDLDNVTSGSIQYETRLNYYANEQILAFQRDVLNPFLHSVYTEKNYTQKEFVNAALKSMNKSFKNTIISVYDIIPARLYLLDNIIKGYYNVQKYGYSDWYVAKTNEWGTNWNAYDTSINGGEILFITANDTPMPIWLALSKFTPITVAFSDEGSSENVGILKFENGECISEFRSDIQNSMINLGKSIAIEKRDVEDVVSEYTDEEIKEYFDTISRDTFNRIILKSYNETQKVLEEQGFYIV
jgi:hypothetical protein